MTKLEVVKLIRKIQNDLVDIRYACSGDQTLIERDAEIEKLQHHLHSAQDILLMLVEDELKGLK